MRHARIAFLFVILTSALAALSAAALSAAPSAAADTPVVDNQAGRLDTLALYDLGNATSALYAFAADAVAGDFTRQLFWQSKAGAFSAARAKVAAGDVNGDGRSDAIVLYKLSSRRVCFYVFLSDGTSFTRKTAWTSPKRTPYLWSRARLTIGDLNNDGRDDAIVLYDRGRGHAELQRFVSSGTRFVKSVGWSGRLTVAHAQLAAGDLAGRGNEGAIVLYRRSATNSDLLYFAPSGSKLVKKTFWDGAYPAGARLAAGDVDSDGDCDAVCLKDNGDGTVSLDVFPSTKTAVATPTNWWTSAAGEVPFATSRLAVGDITGDGKADVVIDVPTGTGSSKLLTCVSSGSAFVSGEWWTGAMASLKTKLAIAPATPFVLQPGVKVLDAPALAALESTSPDLVTMTFASGNTLIDGVAAGDIVVSPPGANLPYGCLRKVTAVTPGGGQTVLTTVQATLAEAVARGELVAGNSFTQDDIVRTLAQAPGVRLVPLTDRAARAHGMARRVDPRFGFSIEITAKLDDKVEVKGQLKFDQSFDVGCDYEIVDWVLFVPIYDITKLSFTTKTSETTTLRASVQGTLDKEIKQELATYQLPTFVVVFGVVPVTFTPEITLYVGASGKVTAGVSAAVTNTTSVTAGLEWRRGKGWKPVTDFTADASFDPPQLFGTMELKAFAGIELMLKVYELAGPTASLEPYLGLFADTRDDPWWKLAAGIEAKLGFKVDVFGLTLAEFETPFTLYEHIIDQANGPFQKPQGVGGTVTSATTLAPIAGATVELRQGADDPGGTLVDTTTTDSAGMYSFDKVPVATYTVVGAKSGYITDHVTTGVLKDQITPSADLALTPVTAQGGSGRIVSSLDGSPVAGATVELHQGWASPAGALQATTTSAADGGYEFTGTPTGDYTVVATKSSYVRGMRDFPVNSGVLTTDVDVDLAPTDGTSPAMADDTTDFIAWWDTGYNLGNGTAEVWFKPASIQRGIVAEVDYGYAMYAIFNGRSPAWRLELLPDGTLRFWLNEDDTKSPYSPNVVTREIDGATKLSAGLWYHLAIEYGSSGMRLYVNGKLDASDLSFTGQPVPNWSNASLNTEAFDVGSNDSWWTDDRTATGRYKWVRVSDVQRYGADFTPATTFTSDGSTVLLDSLLGGTTGENHYLVWTP